MFFYDRLDNVMDKINNFTQLKDFLNQHGIHVDVVDLSEPKINNDKQSGQNGTPKNLQDLFSDIFKDLDLASPVKPLGDVNQESKPGEQQNNAVKKSSNTGYSYGPTDKRDSSVSNSSTKTMNQEQHVNINFPFARTHSVEKHSLDTAHNEPAQTKQEHATTQHDSVAEFTASASDTTPSSATAATQSKIQDIDFKMRELKRKIAVENFLQT